MNRILLTFVAIFLASSFLACDDEESGEIHMALKQVHFTPEGGKTDIDPIVSGSFNVNTDQEWIKTKVENGKIILEVPSFFSGVKREGFIDITNKSSSKKLKVIQFPQMLKVNGDKNISASMKLGGEYTFSVETTFPEDFSRLRPSFKDEADKSWIEAKFNSLSEFAVKVSANPTNKPKKAVVYLIADGDVEVTIMDSIVVNSTYEAEDYIGKWTATFSNKNDKVFTEDVEIVKSESGTLYLKGISAYNDAKVLVDIPIYTGTTQLTIPTGRMYSLLKETDEKYIYLAVATPDYLMWGQGDGPQEYIGYIEYDSNGKPICKFPSFDYYGYKMSFFAFRAYNSSYPSTNIGVTRFIKDLELKMK